MWGFKGNVIFCLIAGACTGVVAGGPGGPIIHAIVGASVFGLFGAACHPLVFQRAQKRLIMTVA